jgi:hypothetical protein
MIRREKLVADEILQKTSMESLAEICPKCYGPPVQGKRDDEPDYIVCMDGNFQHRRHLAASDENPEAHKTPHLFINPRKVQQMAQSMESPMGPNQMDDETVSHFMTTHKDSPDQH